MEDTDNKGKDNLFGLLVLGTLGYFVYKALKESSDDENIRVGKPRLSSSNVKKIVDRIFCNLNEDEIAEFAVFSFMPDILGMKKDLYNRLMLDRLTRINDTIKQMLVNDFEGYNPIHGETQLKELMYFIKNDCYNEIKTTKFIAQLKGNVVKHIPGMKLIGGAMNANVVYKMLKAINNGLKEYFTALYVYGTSITEARFRFQMTYVQYFTNSVF